MRNKINIAIDGPAGAGKSTIAKAIARGVLIHFEIFVVVFFDSHFVEFVNLKTRGFGRSRAVGLTSEVVAETENAPTSGRHLPCENAVVDL